MASQIDVPEAPALLTEPQLREAAEGLSYRCLQVSVVAVMRSRRSRIGFEADPVPAEVIKNALIESALTNSRILAYFFTRPADVHRSRIPSQWKPHNEFVKLARLMGATISGGASHAFIGGEDGETHPGAWPIREMAVLLVGEVTRFFTHLDTAVCDPAWFNHSPVDCYSFLMSSDPLGERTEVSKNEKVGKLTRALLSYLDAHGPPSVAGVT